MKRRVFRMPSPMKITGRTSSITNAFVNSIIPSIAPSEDEIQEALAILGMTPESVQCAYCGDPSTEWDHLRPIVRDKKPTGFITEIGNLVPACGKCNQSKGNQYWRDWITSDANLSPKSKGVKDIQARIERLKAYEGWRPRAPLDFSGIVGDEYWRQHWNNHDNIVVSMKESQDLADKLKALIEEDGAI